MENHETWSRGFERFKERPGTACRTCLLLWYAVQALKMKDPYKVSTVAEVMAKYGVTLEFTSISEAFYQSMAWVGNDDRIINGSSSCADLIKKWRGNRVVSIDEIDGVTSSSEFPWMMDFMKGSIFEKEGKRDLAIKFYRLAKITVPPWSSEAVSVVEKINYLLNRN
jgi:hypothetical protein